MNKYIYLYIYTIYMVLKRRYHDNHENQENNVSPPRLSLTGFVSTHGLGRITCDICRR